MSSNELDTLTTLKEERKWFHLCEMIPNIINSNNADEILNIFNENIFQYHPTTLVYAALKLTNYFNPEKSLEIISKSMASIEDSNMYTGNFKMELIHLEIQKCILLIKMGNIENVETKIFEFKKFEMNPEVYSLYNYLAFLYYEKSKNYEYSVKYLIEYVKKNTSEKTDMNQDLETLAKYALISKNFFNFIEIFTLKNFNKINEDIYKIYIAVQEGNIELIENNKNVLDVIFGDKASIVREKTYFIGLINLCFKETDKKLPFEEIQQELQLSDSEINSFLLKALGLGLLEGWIDDQNKMLYYKAVIPRCLPSDELIKMKSKFTEWKDKIRQAIEMIE